MSMRIEIEFQNSEIADIVIGTQEMEIRFTTLAIVVTDPVTGPSDSRIYSAKGSIKIGKPKYKTLPKQGRISDGELYGIPGKPLNGRLPINFRSERSLELVLANGSVEHSIHGSSFTLQVDTSHLPPLT